MILNSKNGYGIITKVFHWIIGSSIIYLLYLGATMVGLESGQEKWDQYATHKSIGIFVMFLTFIFYMWKSINKTPEYPDNHLKSQKILSSFVKNSLLLIMLLYPISGYLMSAGGGHNINLFGLGDLPLLIEKGQMLFGFEIGKTAKIFHEYLFYITISLLFLHVSGAIFHHFIKKDDVLKRMTYK